MVSTNSAPRFLAAITVAAWMSCPASATADPSTRALLTDPATLAGWLRDRDPIVDAGRAKIEAATEAGRQARVYPNPQLFGTTGDIVLGKTTTGDDGIDRHLPFSQTSIYTLGVSELVELGKRRPRREASDLRVQEASQVAVGTLGARIGDATQLLGRLAYLAAKRDVMATNLAAARQLRDVEKVRLDKQDLAAVEFERIELDTDALELQLSRAEADLQSAVAACNASLYIACSPEGLDLPALDAAAPLPAGLPVTEATIAARPAHVAQQLEAKALDWDAALAAHRKIPDLTLGLSYTLDNLVVSGDQHQSLAFSVGIPLPMFDRGNHDAAAARANAHAIESEEHAQLREDRGVAESLQAQLGALSATLQRLETGEIPKSTQIITQTRKAFDLGQARLPDLLLVERAHRDLLVEVIDTRFELFNVRAALRQTLGLDDELARSVTRQP